MKREQNRNDASDDSAIKMQCEMKSKTNPFPFPFPFPFPLPLSFPGSK